MATPLRRWVRQHARRFRAEALFLFRGLRVLVRPTAGLALTVAVATVIERLFGAPPGGEPPGWAEAAFIVWGLLLGEIGGELPAEPLGRAASYLLPLIGVFFLAEGVIKLGLVVFNKDEQSEAWVSILANESRQHVVVCGLGTVGFRIVEELLALGEQVFVIERKGDGDYVALARALGAEVLIGDARTENLLRSMNVGRARSVIVATNDDLANLEIAMDVREQFPEVPIVLRLYDQRLAKRVGDSLKIQLSVSTSKLAAPLFASAAIDPAVVGTHRVGEKLMVVVEHSLGPTCALVNRTVGEVSRAYALSIVAIRPAGEDWCLHPDPDARLAPYTVVQFMVPGPRARTLRQLTG